MSTRLVSLVVDAADPAALARFWADALGWRLGHVADDEVDVVSPDGEAPDLVIVAVARPERRMRRLHLDLATTSLDHQRETVARLCAAGAAPLDIGQGDVPWVVLADPEGNPFCVLEPRATYAGTGALAAVVFDVDRPSALAPFWVAASGWAVVDEDGERQVSLRRPDGRGPFLELVSGAEGPKVAKIPIHLDVAPWADDDQAAEVDRLAALGARPADVGQGDETWVVLADPAGNEFCVLSARS